MNRALAAALTASVLVLTGCSSPEVSFPTPGSAKVDVDTPELRTIKEAAGVEDCVPGTGDPVEGGMPALTLACLGGGPQVDLSRLSGPMVINLWQSFCGPCRIEMPALQAFYEKYGDEVAVLGIDYLDTQPRAALELAKETGVTYPLVADAGGELNRKDPFPPVLGLPYLAFVDAQGRLAYTAPGGVESAQELVDLVNEHLGVGL